jgi:hypothetical protein
MVLEGSMRRRLRRKRGKLFGPSWPAAPGVLTRTVTSHFTFHLSLSLTLAVRRIHCFGGVNETERGSEGSEVSSSIPPPRPSSLTRTVISHFTFHLSLSHVCRQEDLRFWKR